MKTQLQLLLLAVVLLSSTTTKLFAQKASLASNKDKKEVAFPTRDRILTKSEKEKLANDEQKKQDLLFEKEAQTKIFKDEDVELVPLLTNANGITIDKFIVDNVNGLVPVNNDAPAGTYKVVINFTVMRDGSITDIKPATNFKFGMEDEAIRVVKLTNKLWSPATKNGINVMCEKSMYITFKIQ